MGVRALRCPADMEQAVDVCLRFAPRVLVVDLEPFLLHWDAAADQLQHTLVRLIERLRQTTIETVIVVTNSRRELGFGNPSFRFVNRARKPWTSRAALGLTNDRRPGVVCGDVLITDGLLAARLGYPFVHLTVAQRPLYPRIQDGLGGLLFGRLFTDCASS